MKIKSSVSYCLLFLFLFAAATMAQDMKPDAAKLYNKGNKMLKEGKYTQAIDNYNKALDIQKDFRIYYQRGVALKKNGNINKAKVSFENCISSKPDFAYGYNALGGVYFALGKYDSAATNFQKVLSLAKSASVKKSVSQNIALAYSKLGDQEASNGNPKKAINYLEKAVSSSHYDAAYLSLAKIYSETGQYDKSLEAAQNALKYRESIGRGGPEYYMGVAYKKKGDVEKAKEMFNKAKKDPTYKKLAKYELSGL